MPRTDTVELPGPLGDEVDYRDLQPGKNYYISKWGTTGERWGRAKGINFTGTVIYDGDSEGKTTGLSTGPPDVANLNVGDPLVTFERIDPRAPKHKKECGICSMSHLKPYNAGRKQNIGFKFHEMRMPSILMDGATQGRMPEELVPKIMSYGSKRNKKKRRKTRRPRKSRRKRNKPRKTRRKRNNN